MALARRAIGLVGACAVVALIAWLLLRPPGGMLVRAYFSDARGLVAGNDVRINGAPAGTVTGLVLARNDQALVTMRLDSDIPYAPRSNATAAIRPVDLLGDSYVALTLGSGAPLRGPIPASRTLDAPQLSDLLSAFRQPQRAALGALLVGLGETLDQRGADLNQAALELRPALQAADGVMGELGSQNADLRQVIADADQITEQAAAHNRALGRSVGELHELVALTARHLPGLSSGLLAFPSALGQLTRTAGELQSTAQAAEPLAVTLRSVAPPLSSTAQRLPGFLDALRGAAQQLHPALRGAATLLSQADPSLYALGSGLRELSLVGGDLSRFAGELVPAAPDIVQGFFVNFPAEAAEPGNQPLDPFANPLRHYWRGAGVFSCEAFGLPIAPGCLSRFLAAGSSQGRGAARRPAHSRPPRAGRNRRSLGGRSSAAPARSRSSGALPPVRLHLPLPLPVTPATPTTPSPSSLGRLLSYLLRP
jgi:virulence factor Mce-like protein